MTYWLTDAENAREEMIAERADYLMTHFPFYGEKRADAIARAERKRIEEQWELDRGEDAYERSREGR